MENKKEKVSKSQFAELLYHLQLSFVSRELIEKSAKRFGFDIKNAKDFNKIFEELLFLNMWIIVYTCDLELPDKDIKNKCLDLFHHLVYSRRVENKENSFAEWMIPILSMYAEYNEAMQTKHSRGPLWVLATTFNKKLFGEFKKDIFIHMAIVAHIGLVMEYFRDTIKLCDIE